MILLLIVPIAVGVLFLLYNNYTGNSSTNNGQPLIQDTKDMVVGDLSCHESSKYFVVESGVTGSVGTNFLVKYKTSDRQKIQCLYNTEEADFEIKNEWAEYYLDLTNDFLVLDSGTGPPPRGLIVYDLVKHKKVFEDSYSEPITIQGNVITYWSSLDIEATPQNCEKLAEYSSMGFGAGIEAFVSVDLTNLTKKELGEYRCNPRQ